MNDPRHTVNSSATTPVVLLFPFTSIPVGTSPMLQACFGGLTLLRPTSDDPLEEAGAWLEGRLPPGVDEKLIRTLIREYGSWAELHQGQHGIDGGLHRLTRDPAPFAQDGALSHIRDAIRRAAEARPPEDADASLTRSLIFLNLAERYDRESGGVQEMFQDLSRRETELFDALRGDERVRQRQMSAGKATPSDPGSYMTPERLNAWAYVAWRTFAEPPFPTAAVTTSRAVIEALAEALEGFDEIVRLGSIPSGRPDDESIIEWRRQLIDYLERLAADVREAPGPPPMPPPGGGAHASLTLYAAPDVDWPSFLAVGCGIGGATGKKGARMIVALVQKEG